MRFKKSRGRPRRKSRGRRGRKIKTSSGRTPGRIGFRLS